MSMKTKIILSLILLLAFLLRFVNLNSLPSLNPDEAALGYNAYSLLQTGLDEHGDSFPLHFKSFGDFKPGGYVYLAMPFIKIFGLTPLTVRLPNLILSVLTIYIVYKLILLLTRNFQLSAITAFVLAVNPWHIHFSRGAWESSTALFFIVLGTYLFYSYLISHKTLSFYFSLLSFIFSLYVYHSARIISPLLVLVLFISNYKYLLSKYKSLILPCIIAFLLAIPVLVSFLNNGGTTRFGGVGLTADYGPISRSEELLNQHQNFNYFDRIVHNKRVMYLLSWGQKYLSHFDANFLFLKGDEVPRSKSPDIGQMHLFELPLLLLGIVLFLKSKIFHSNSKYFIIFFILIAPLASSLTFQAPSALRSLPLVIPLSILIAFALHRFIHESCFLILVSILYFISVFYFLDSYSIHSPKRYPFAWNSAFEQVVPYINQNKDSYQHIFFTIKYDQPYILYLFYTKYHPAKIQNQIALTPPDKYGFSTVNQIDNITFNIPDYSTIPGNSLIISADPIPNVNPVKTINFSNGSPAFTIYTK